MRQRDVIQSSTARYKHCVGLVSGWWSKDKQSATYKHSHSQSDPHAQSKYIQSPGQRQMKTENVQCTKQEGTVLDLKYNFKDECYLIGCIHECLKKVPCQGVILPDGSGTIGAEFAEWSNTDSEAASTCVLLHLQNKEVF